MPRTFLGVSSFLPYYLQSCGLLLLPVLVWNMALYRYLPPAYASAAYSRDIPGSLMFVENVLRFAVFALPFLMPLRLVTREQRVGLMVFVVGTLVYFASWLLLIAVPESTWARSALGFLSPAYTPALWLMGLAMVGRQLFWLRVYRPWMYAVLAGGFLLAHIAHAAIVYARH